MMICHHENDISQECFEGIDSNGNVMYSCMYCGKQYNHKGELIFNPLWKKDD